MRYAIITNPVSGKMTVDQKRSVLAKAAKILNAEIHGLDSITADDLCQCARGLANYCDVLVAATPIAYLPLGTGNAMRHALKYKGNLADIAMRIREGEICDYDLIKCNNKKRAFTVSIGLEGTVIRLRDQYVAQGATGFKAYFRAVLNSYFKEYKRATARITIDNKIFEVKNLLSLMIVKHPYYGFGMKVVPKARFDDRKLHVFCINSGLFQSVIGAVSAFTIGNRIGQYHTGRHLSVKLDRPLVMQSDGNEGWEADAFTFSVLPNAIKIKC
jgi:diacylglycerol kinase family enzyme